ncbi:hypothetical protein F444_15768 [Phytophthora nicotianae P1976]|uniref:Uncharacterized protein n=1 Tax=Phytophthora nicotianae P1976 TaxID=1317066 RepID=A0A080ZKW6_PHYNI|nr:hypothetical protein F444_15768 [Phytophthora nicotianae P1976]
MIQVSINRVAKAKIANRSHPFPALGRGPGVERDKTRFQKLGADKKTSYVLVNADSEKKQVPTCI